MKPWRGVWPAIKPGSKCLQYNPLAQTGTSTQASLQGDEDCLYLNVYSPMVCAVNSSTFSMMHAGVLWAILRPLVSRLDNLEWLGDMNWKGFGTQQSSPNQGTISALAWRD
jgi:hypothetical protein